MPTKSTHPSTERERMIRQTFDKIVVNAGIGRASQQGNFEDKILPQIMRDLSALAGQKPQVRRAKKSIAGFKTREGQVIGARVTLRGRKMVDFFERMITIVLPRVRDFSGLDESIVDEGGVLNIGFKEQLVFPEINPEESVFIFSLAVNAVPRLKKRAGAIAAYRTLGVPLKSGETTKKKK